MKKLKYFITVLAVIAFTGMSNAVYAAEHVVEMLNKGDEGAMVFKPAVVFAKAGDTIKFVPTKKGHNVTSFDDMLPEGVKPFKSKISKEFTLTVEKDGSYAYYCQPHLALGMVGLIIVGDNVDLSAIKFGKKVKGKAKKRLEKYIEEASK